MLWPSCLNAVSKKSNLSRALFCSILIAFLLPVSLYSIEPAYLPVPQSNQIRFQAALTPEEVARLQEALKDGYKAEISFSLRVYEARKTVFFGDLLLYETQYTYTARWDPVSREYLLSTSTGEQSHFLYWNDFQSAYTRSPLFQVPPQKGNPVYITCQVKLKPKLFNPPLQILNSVGPLETLESRWVRMDKSP